MHIFGDARTIREQHYPAVIRGTLRERATRAPQRRVKAVDNFSEAQSDARPWSNNRIQALPHIFMSQRHGR